ncbi:MAG: CehA/McbA family metallohydrolase [Bryobacterales bacterium]|nr:CehA/McbA family metallohydrolase [Bryobacterales bacterium]
MRLSYFRGNPRRAALLLLFAGLLYTAKTSENPTPADERTFEASRTGFQPIEYPGPLTREDFVRLLLRRTGEFRIPLTINYRDWRMSDPPDLWEMDLPGAVKARIAADGRTSITYGQEPLTLGIGETFNLPVLVRNDTGVPAEIKLEASIGGIGVGDGFKLPIGLSYLSLNLRPTVTGRQTVRIDLFAGPPGPEGPPPQSKTHASFSTTVDVVEWGELDITVLEDGEPTTARVTAFGSDGLAYAPADGSALAKITWSGGQPFFYARGKATLRLPAGVARLTAVRGFETESNRAEIRVRPGETAAATLNLRRTSRISGQGWWSGDSHIHMNYNDHEFLGPADMLLQVEGEDLNVANLMVANSVGWQVHDDQYFEGKPHALSTPRHKLRWIEEMRANLYGHMCLPGISTLIKPLYTGFPDSPHPWDFPPNYNQAAATQKAGGVASYAHPGYNFTEDPFTMSARELPVDAALGVVEAMDVLSNSNERAVTPYYYRLLDTGLRLVISGGSDSFTNRRHHWLAGGQRVFVNTGKPTLDYGEWVDAYRAGNSFVSNGPLLEFTVNSQPPGAEIAAKPGDTVKVSVRARSIAPMRSLEIVRNGEVIATAQGPGSELSLDHELTLDGPAWIAARVDGDWHPLVVNDFRLYAHTTPVWLTVDGKRYRDPEAARFFAGWIDRLIEGVRTRGRFEHNADREEVVRLFERAKEFYTAE